MDLERELTLAMQTHAVPPPAPDPVAAVHAGMRRRRRRQRLQTVCAAVAAIGVVGAVTWAVSDPRGPRTAPLPIATQQLLPVPDGFRATDLSWVSVEEGFATGTAPCGTGTCSHLLRTSDGGATWSATLGTGLPHDCGATCPSRVRFADSAVGYVFGPALFMTSDGGTTWTSQPGPDTYGVEASNGTAVRVVTDEGCPGCRFEVQRSAVGTSSWTTVHRSQEPRSGAELARQVDQVAVSLLANPAGGAGDAHISLLLSPDGGTTWARHDDPCDQGTTNNDPDETDAAQVGLSLTGEVVALCQRRGWRSNGGNSTVTLSADGGSTFATPTGFPEATDADLVAAAGHGVLLAETHRGNDVDVVLQRSDDGGRTWTEVARAPLVNGPREAAYLAFSTASVATWVPQPGRSAWRSTDGGVTWVERPFRRQ